MTRAILPRTCCANGTSFLTITSPILTLYDTPTSLLASLLHAPVKHLETTQAQVIHLAAAFCSNMVNDAHVLIRQTFGLNCKPHDNHVDVKLHSVKYFKNNISTLNQRRCLALMPITDNIDYRSRLFILLGAFFLAQVFGVLRAMEFIIDTL